jgi:HlyD family secretion protein
MTLADLSVITAEVKVDETDIVSVKLGQESEVTVDALPNKTFKGKVTEVGSSALTRSTGQAADQASPTRPQSTGSQRLQVVVTLLDPSDTLKPGLSTTAKITTAVRSSVLVIPIQALTVRELEKELQRKEPSSTPKSAKAAGNSERSGDETTSSADQLVRRKSSKESSLFERQRLFLFR